MFSDSICEVIDLLLKDTKHYNEEPFCYSLEYKKYIINALTNLYYIQMRLDHLEWDKYKESKVMLIAEEQAKMRINRIEDGLDAYESEEENVEISDLKKLNKKLKSLDKKLDRHLNSLDK